MDKKIIGTDVFSTLLKFAELCLKKELMKHRLEVFQNESGSKGVDYIIKTKTGNYHEVLLHVLNLETTERSVQILKSDWNYELPRNMWVALVLL